MQSTRQWIWIVIAGCALPLSAMAQETVESEELPLPPPPSKESSEKASADKDSTGDGESGERSVLVKPGQQKPDQKKPDEKTPGKPAAEQAEATQPTEPPPLSAPGLLDLLNLRPKPQPEEDGEAPDNVGILPVPPAPDALDSQLPPVAGQTPAATPTDRPRLAAPMAPNLGQPMGQGGVVVGSPRSIVVEGQPLPPGVAPGAAPAAAVVPAVPMRVKDSHKKYPGGVPTTVKIHAPHDPRRGVTVFGPQFVQVIVPPFPAREVKYNRDGSEVKLDFGKYEVKVHYRRDGLLEIDYND